MICVSAPSSVIKSIVFEDNALCVCINAAVETFPRLVPREHAAVEAAPTLLPSEVVCRIAAVETVPTPLRSAAVEAVPTLLPREVVCRSAAVETFPRLVPREDRAPVARSLRFDFSSFSASHNFEDAFLSKDAACDGRVLPSLSPTPLVTPGRIRSDPALS